MSTHDLSHESYERKKGNIVYLTNLTLATSFLAKVICRLTNLTFVRFGRTRIFVNLYKLIEIQYSITV